MSNIATLPAAPEQQLPVAESVSSNALIFDDRSFERVMRFAELMASGRATVPKHLQGSVGDCMAVTMQAMRWRMDPFSVGQKTHVVNGTLGYEAQLVNAVVQESGAIEGRFHYEYKGSGQDVECRVGAVIRGEREITWGEWLSAASVQVKNSPLWKTNPKQQLGYLQVKNWARAYCPGAILGVYTADELEQAPPAERDMGAAEVIDPATPPATRTAALKDRMGVGKDKPKEPAKRDQKPAVTLAQVLVSIAHMRTKDEREAAKAQAELLTDPLQIDEARSAYAKRLEAIKAEASAQPDPQDEALRQVEQAGRTDMSTGEFFPTPEEEAAIREREMREAAGDQQ